MLAYVPPPYDPTNPAGGAVGAGIGDGLGEDERIECTVVDCFDDPSGDDPPGSMVTLFRIRLGWFHNDAQVESEEILKVPQPRPWP